MIKIINDKTKIKFGTGDICVTPGLKDGVGLIGMMNHEPHEIGCYYYNDEIYKSDEDFLNKTNVIISFSKIESVDVVIDALLQIRTAMQIGEHCYRNLSEEVFGNLLQNLTDNCYTGRYNDNGDRVEKSEDKVLVHGSMHYKCEKCGDIFKMYLQEGVEGPGKIQPCPFTIVHTCEGLASHVMWNLDEYFKPRQLKSNENYFALGERCGKPILKGEQNENL